MKERFTHLHVHSHYSLLDGLPKIGELLDRAKNLGMDSIALTDHGNLYGLIEFYQKARQKGIKPIFGCEVYVAPRRRDQKEPATDKKAYHLTLLAENNTGYQNLVQLITKANLEGFYYHPRVDEELLAQHHSGLIALSGCLQGKIPHLILTRRLEEAKKTAKKYQKIFGSDNFYLEIQPHLHLEQQTEVNQTLIAFSQELGIPLVGTNDVHYLKSEDAEAQDILMLINTKQNIDTPNRHTMLGENFSLLSPQEMISLLKETPEAVENTNRIADRCRVNLELGKVKLPAFSLPDNQTADEYLAGLCQKGIKKKYGRASKAIENRLQRELAVIKQMKFASYFLIVQDFVHWAKAKHIVVGPGRGSAPGSLVSYLLDITSIDPLKYNLLFERFLNPDRISMPDIDLDFTDRRRDEVLRYITQKYGTDHVAQIITFGTMAARGAIRDVGRVLHYPYIFCDKIAKAIPMNLSLQKSLQSVGELKQRYEEEEKVRRLIDLAQKLEGTARHASTHACGVVISDAPLTGIVPLQHPPQNKEQIITQYEMGSIEALGLLKVDLLGLKNLTTIEDALHYIYAVQKKNIDIEKIPLNDKKTYQLLRQGKTTGVFQLECLPGDTIISNTTIKRLYERKNKDKLESIYLDEGAVHKNEIKAVLKTGKKEVYSLITRNNWYVKATKNHYFMTEKGWKKLKDIKEGEKVLVKKGAKHLIYNTCKTCGKQISGQGEGESQFCYSCAAKYYKNPSKKRVGSKIGKSMKVFYEKGGKPWNRNKTKDNEVILKATGKKISKALKGKTWEEIYGKKAAAKRRKQSSERITGRRNHMFGKTSPHRKGGYRKDLGHYVRSSWEADFARILKYFNLDYEYEPKIFSLTTKEGKEMNYTPDFYVPAQDTFYEIKGFMRKIDQEKINLFKKQYPGLNLEIINTTKFAEMEMKYRNLVNWECPRVPAEQSFDFMPVKKIKYSGQEETYDIKMKSPGNNFIANGFVVHNSNGMKTYLQQLKPTKFEDIIAMVALYRPGPMQFIPQYIKRKQGQEKSSYLHPKLKPILENTYGIAVYQEQIMQIAHHLAGFSLSEADILRKAIGKKDKKLLIDQKSRFLKGAEENKIPKEAAQKIWAWIIPFARYSFNLAHAASYANIAYQTAYLKANYPLEFMAALLTSHQGDNDKISFLIRECEEMKIPVLPPDINQSFRNFSVVPREKKIRFGLSAIKNVGQKIVVDILQERKENGFFQSFEGFLERTASLSLEKKTLESLAEAGAFDRLIEREKIVNNLARILAFLHDLREQKKSHQQSLFQASDSKPRLHLPNGNTTPLKTKLEWEKKLLGLYVSAHPLDEFKKIFRRETTPIREIITGSWKRGQARIGGIIVRITKILTRNQQQMIFAELEDQSGRIEVIVFPNTLEQYSSLFKENKILIIQGQVSHRDNQPKLICDLAEEIISQENYA